MTRAVFLPDPQYTSWENWIRTVVEQIAGEYVYPDESKWRDAAKYVSFCPPFNRQQIVDPNFCTDWREWARRLARTSVYGV